MRTIAGIAACIIEAKLPRRLVQLRRASARALQHADRSQSVRFTGFHRGLEILIDAGLEIHKRATRVAEGRHSATGERSGLRCREKLRQVRRTMRIARVAHALAVLLGTICLGSAELGAAPPTHTARMSWLDNGTIRLGVDLELGGAITWLSKSGEGPNVINSFDWGRQVQMSFYSGPIPFLPGGRQPSKVWETLGWNPIQSGDYVGHRSHVVEQTNDGHRLYVKCVPMQWPLDDVPGDCTFESWIELDGTAVRARCRLVNARTDRTQYPARQQEMPAVYTNAPWHRIITYSGAEPFTGGALREIALQPPPQWSHWIATENWSALLDDSGWGLGVWNRSTTEFIGGFSGRPGTGGATDAPCGYLSPTRPEILDHDIDYAYEYDLVLGTAEEIRARALHRTGERTLPRWDFTEGRLGWHYRNAEDSGWRASDGLRIQWDKADPQLESPPFFCRAEEAPTRW